jgi:hypothetical protein
MREAIFKMQEQRCPKNTSLAYSPKIGEFIQFCDYKYSRHDASSRYIVTCEKIYTFLFYQCMRDKRKRGGYRKKKKSEDVEEVDTALATTFSPSDFKAVIKKYSSTTDAGLADWPEPDNPVGYDTINTYKSSIKNLWERQVARCSNNLSWSHVWTIDCKNLVKVVKERKAFIDKKNYVEKIDHEFAPYTAMEEVHRIEKALWKKGESGGLRMAYAWLRNRFCLLNSLNGILRCESLYKAELSDLLCLQMKKQRDPHPLTLLIMQMATGKS